MKKSLCCQTDPQSKKDFLEVSDFLKIINEPNRLKIICFLKTEEQCVCDIWTNIDLPQNLASHHLKILKNFGLIHARQEGRKIIYASNQEAIQNYTARLNNFLSLNL